MHNTDTYTGASFSLQNRVLRLVWNLCYLILFKYSPRPFHAWRSFVLRLFGAKLGKNVHIYPKVQIWAPWNLVIGNDVGVANGVDLYSQGLITLEDRVIISQRSYLCTGTHDYTKKGHPLYTQPITVKKNAWVAAECFVGPGVTIGEGAVLGSRAAAYKDVAPWTIVGGNPAKYIKDRILEA
ncbi:putative colanic acid biosynthesis acetyltransferase [Flavobacterium sp. ASW18X]|uniref:putative colanic acid biosynthesis acetyltransferase n=1 Tax=Flavobacterium sp. ASW18X TaxID=2572595 RepID=UPI0010AE23EE|nr:putative colanic acid biosynthesis acetyltransferase [Flavobacterium sp. ASW18X]TKD65536.1 putative colanic acid biosynthesis acetyltransferase [Flavobacterium sp. ASW18X]